MASILSFFKRTLFAWRFRRAVRQANSLAELFNCRYIVIVYAGRLKVIPRRSVPDMVRAGIFRRGTTPEMIYRRALYSTPIRQTPKAAADVSIR